MRCTVLNNMGCLAGGAGLKCATDMSVDALLVELLVKIVDQR